MEDYPSNPEATAPGEDSSDDTTSTKSSKKKSSISQPSLSANSIDQKEDGQKPAEQNKGTLAEPVADLLEQLRAMTQEEELPKEAAEIEAPLEHLGAEEKRLASTEVVRARQTELASGAEAVVADSPQAAADAASQLYLENLHNKLNKFQPRELTAEEAIDIAAQETELQLLASSDAMAESESQVLSSAEGEGPSFADSHEFRLDPEDEEPAAGDAPDLAETVADQTEIVADAPDANTAASAVPNTSPPSNPNSSPTSAGTGMPPDPNMITPGGDGPAGPSIPFAPAGFGHTPNNFNNSPSATVYNTGPVLIERNPSRDAGMFFAGAIIGYFIGRRRGRIKTEKRLKQIQKKLEKEVEDLSARISARETQIRNQSEAIARQKLLLKKQQQSVVSAEYATVAVTTQEKILSAKSSAPETHIVTHEPIATLEPAVQPAENLSPVADEAAAIVLTVPVAAAAAEAAKFHTAAVAEHSREKSNVQNEQLSQRELLDISQNIRIDNVRLSEMYQKGRIDSKSLRILVNEYMRVGDVKELLGTELKKQEQTPFPGSGAAESVAKELRGTTEPIISQVATSNSEERAAPYHSAEQQDPELSAKGTQTHIDVNRQQQLEQKHSRQTNRNLAVTLTLIVAIGMFYFLMS